jgi:hypothetical protein
MTKIRKNLLESIDDIYVNRINLWKDSPFENLTYLSNDERGKWGERFIFNLIKLNTNLSVEWDEDSNTNNNDGVYDIAILHNNNKIRIEVKTATRGNTKTSNWQHENIYSSNKWDKLLLFDIDFYGFYITIIDYEDMVFNHKHSIFGRKPTLRNNQDDKYKFDFGDKQQKNGIDSNLTFYYDLTNPQDDELVNFLTSKIL